MAEDIYFAVKDPIILARIKEIDRERRLHKRMEGEIKKLEREILAELSLATTDGLTKREVLAILLLLIRDKFSRIRQLALTQFFRIAIRNSALIHRVMTEALGPTGLGAELLRELTEEEIDSLISSVDDGWDYEERVKSIEREFEQAIRAAVNSSERKQYNFELVTLAVTTASRSAQRQTAIRTANQYTNIITQSNLGYARANSQAVRFVKFTAILDSRTSDICRGFHGNIYDVIRDRGRIPRPKLHPNCRSELVPVFDVDYLRRQGAVDDSYLDIDPTETESLADFLKRTS